MSENCLSQKQLLLPQPSKLSIESKSNISKENNIEKDQSLVNLPDNTLQKVITAEVKNFKNPKNKSFYYKQPML